MNDGISVSDNGAAFVSFVERVLPTIESDIRARLPHPYETSETKSLSRYLYGPLERFVLSGGKRIRPALCLLGAVAVGAEERVALSAACAVEMFQAAALIHDDIADKSEMRRGLPCLHRSEGTGVAINIGDVGIVDVAATVLHDTTLDRINRMALFDEIYDMERQTLEGQALDLGWARDGRWDIDEHDYLAMARLKTAHYSCATPLAMGAICGNGTGEQIETLRSFGLSCGLAFQIQDDLLNLVGDADAQGKDYRSDITEGKRTLLMVHALGRLDSQDARELEQILSSHTAETHAQARAVELANKAGSIEYAHEYALGLVDEAKVALQQGAWDEDSLETLFSMADYFVSRTY